MQWKELIENFVNGVFSEKAYDDTPLPIACGQTISQPTVVGLMTQALRVTSRDKVLEVELDQDTKPQF